MFVDYTKLKVIAGNGGNGSVSFRREKFIPKGGPDGGNGGRGGHVIFKVDPQLYTLQDIKYRKQYKAANGVHGSGGNKTGKWGKDVIIPVPPGTVLRKEGNKESATDLTEVGQEFIGAQGGRGGKGNTEFATATRQTPTFAEDGTSGEIFIYEVELKLLADVGLVGFPNAGKSTLLSTLTAARPKIAEYPFTTLEPHLGIVKYQDYGSFLMADIPGLIEGASKGKGLGHQFLKHIERTRVLAILVESTATDIEAECKTLIEELSQYSEKLMKKPKIVVLTKMDLLGGNSPREFSPILNLETLTISSVTRHGLDVLVNKLVEMIHE